MKQAMQFLLPHHCYPNPPDPKPPLTVARGFLSLWLIKEFSLLVCLSHPLSPSMSQDMVQKGLASPLPAVRKMGHFFETLGCDLPGNWASSYKNG